MRSILIFLLLAGVGIITWLVLSRPDRKEEKPKQQALAVSKHSDAFNTTVESFLSDYENLSEAFVKWDSTGVIPIAQTLIKDLDSVNLEELKKDSAAIYETAAAFIENAKGDLQTIAAEKNIRPQREVFNNLTDNVYQFLNTVRYDREKLYLQECPMAFDDVQAAKWLSKKEQIRNPYLGLKDPKYGKGMLSCGETIKTINHTGKE
ncbi:MAG: DUF3347 domain-containing protein [Chitinophagaceae bacterium]|nr:MAG: DUF3347 domain-containing protein [Chitinophagaceae bacterium]